MEKKPPQYIDKKARLRKLLHAHPLDWFGMARTGWTTFFYRVIAGCIGKNAVVGYGTELMNVANIAIGNNVFLQDHVFMRAGTDGTIAIADHCAINSFAKLFGHGGITVGEYSQIGPGALITTTSHDIRNEMKAEFKAVTIGKWVWIGAQAIILPGITIGDYAVIGAGSIVTKNVPAFAVAVGNPARVIGENELEKARQTRQAE